MYSTGNYDGMSIQRPDGYDEAIVLLSTTVERAASHETCWEARLAAGLDAALELLADDPSLAHLLFVETLEATRPVPPANGRQLEELAAAMQPSLADVADADGMPVETELMPLLATGAVSYLSARIQAGEGNRLPADHGFLMWAIGARSVF